MHVTKYVSAYPLTDSLTLLINSLTGALDVLDEPSWNAFKALKEGNPTQLPANFGEELRQRGYLFDDETQERSLVEKMLRVFETEYNRPMRIVVCPTYGCPLRCTYCFEGDIRASKRVLNYDEIVQIFRVANHLRQNRARDITVLELFGGEPFYPVLARPALEQIFPRARDNGYAVIAVTSGAYVKSYRDLISQNLDVFEGVQVTLDGPKEIHNKRRIFAGGRGTFDKIVEGVECLLDLGVRVSIRVNVDRNNIEHLPELANFIVERGWPSANQFAVEVAPVTDHHGSGNIDGLMVEHEIVTRTLQLCEENANMSRLAKLYMFRVLNHITVALGIRKGLITVPRYHYCEANNMEYFVFGPDHYLYACPETVGIPKYSIGRYFPDLEIDEEKAALWDQRHVFSIPECRDCNIAAFCGGGCAYAAMVQYNCTRHPVCDNAPQILAAFVDIIKDDIVARYHAIREGQEPPISNLDFVLSKLDTDMASVKPKAC